MGTASTNEFVIEANRKVKELFSYAERALKLAGLEREARALARCEPDPTTPHSCTYGTLSKVETSVLLEWGGRLMGRGTLVARALRAVSIAKTGFFATATCREPPLSFLGELVRQTVYGEDARIDDLAEVGERIDDLISREDTPHGDS